MPQRGIIVSIEGVDAVGKLTQASLLAQWLERLGLDVSSLSFPDYETPIGREIRAFLSGERDYLPELRHMLFAANRWEKIPEIRAWQRHCDVIIINRYSESNLVYGLANGLKLKWLEGLEAGIPKANIVLVLDAPPNNLVSRREGVKDRYEKDAELQNQVRRIYRRLAKKFGWTIIDASGNIDAIHRAVTDSVHSYLSRRGGIRK